jgi:hypothetical protein
MVFVLAWIIGEAIISLSCELLKFIFLIACVVVLLHHHSWAPLADVALPEKSSHGAAKEMGGRGVCQRNLLLNVIANM